MTTTADPTTTDRRRWGGDTRTEPLPPVSQPISDRTVSNGRIAVLLTIVAWVAFIVVTVVQQFIVGQASNPRFKFEAISYMVIVTLLALSSLSYLMSRLGFFYRTRVHRRVSRAALDSMLATTRPAVAVLVPSYEEEDRHIRMALLSAALQEYPDIAVTLLIDDNPVPKDRRRAEMLRDARQIPITITEELDEVLGLVTPHIESVRANIAASGSTTAEDQSRLVEAFESASSWVRGLAAAQVRTDNIDAFFAEHVLGALADDLERTAQALRQAVGEGSVLAPDRMREVAQRLESIFTARLSSFERKSYVSLSQSANKATNLNSYLSLMGGSYADLRTSSGRVLSPVEPGTGTLEVPDPDYVLTLDADSVLLPEYVARMVYLLERAENDQIAIAQTPYSSYPGASTRLERIAGATTDIQHIAHQGYTYYDATFWVGANAVIRKAALDELVIARYEGDYLVRSYIRDRTVIEDTESSMDLRIHGWQLVNYPERLSYSATPPDFGSLSIQRRRWADGGLLIVPKLWRHSRIAKERGEVHRFSETWLRLSYMASIFWSTVCVLLILAYPFNQSLLSPLVLIVALPYFLAMASDLRYCGYRRTDMLRIYGFNLILIPVNLAGALNSILQGVTGEKVAFKRTPKIHKRTPAGLWFVLTPYLLLGLSIWTAVHAQETRQWGKFAFGAFNSVLIVYAIAAFMGIGNSLADLWASLTKFLYVPVKQTSQSVETSPEPEPLAHASSWEKVLDD